MSKEKQTPSPVTIGQRMRLALQQAREGQLPAVNEYTYPEREGTEVRAVAEAVPRSLRIAAAVAWRFLVVAGALAIVGYLTMQLWTIVVSVLLALLFTVLLEPLLRAFLFLRFPRALAALATLLLGLVAVLGLLWLASTQIISGISDLWLQAQAGIARAVTWLWNGPLQLDQQRVMEYWSQLQIDWANLARTYSGMLANGALNVTSSIGTVATQAIVILFCVFFFLKDGRIIWQWFVRLLPASARSSLNEGVIRGWVTLGSYARTQALVAAIDAVFISGAAYLLGLPLWFPLAILVFIGGFIPYVGAFATGAIAVLVAMVDQGLTSALIMAVVILIVQQIEGNILSPLLMSNAVDLHPVAVLLVVTGAGYLFGIIGAMFAVPVAAFFNTVVLYLYGHDKFLRLNYDQNRPGGAPDTLAREIDHSLRPTKRNVRESEQMRQLFERESEPDEDAVKPVGGKTAERRFEEVKAEVAAEAAEKDS